MLNSTPSSTLPRRRGAQPSNRNTLKHGLYARKHPAAFAPLVHSVAASLPALYTDPAIFSQAVLALRQQIAALLQASQEATGLRSVLTWHRAVLHGITLLKQIMLARQRFLQPHEHLQFLASHALDLIRYDFRSSGVTRDAYSFREKISKSDLNLLPTPQDDFPYPTAFPHLFLTPIQCQILQPLLPLSPPLQIRSFPRRGRIWRGAGGEVASRSPSRLPSASPRRHLLENSPSRPLARPPDRFSPHADLPPLL
jgi:hypothetical protein